jgi:hypothetical protein
MAPLKLQNKNSRLIRSRSITTKSLTSMKVIVQGLTVLDQVPVVIYELIESAINFIGQDSFEKAMILLQKCQTMLDQI